MAYWVIFDREDLCDLEEHKECDQYGKVTPPQVVDMKIVPGRKVGATSSITLTRG